MASVNLCPCCGEAIGFPGDECSFCGYIAAAAESASYREVFHAPLERLEAHAGLLRIEQMLDCLEGIESELTEMLQGMPEKRQILCKP